MTIQELLTKSVAFAKAYDIASEVHKDDRRKSGDLPYMVHIDAVILYTYDLLIEAGITDWQEIEIFLIVAALHDAVEDHPELISFRQIRDYLTPHIIWKSEIDSMMDALVKITKLEKGTQDYAEYVLGVASNLYSRIVKRADLKHNMSDLKWSSLYDKYSLTKWVLEVGYHAD